tara:strand:- start:67334 stop:68053 length:720 start_codon:yes stop_codon:yes gene_type:complete
VLYYASRETFSPEKISSVKAELQRQENLLWQCEPKCHAHSVRKSVFSAEIADAQRKLKHAEEEIEMARALTRCDCDGCADGAECNCPVTCPCTMKHVANKVSDTIDAVAVKVEAGVGIPMGAAATTNIVTIDPTIVTIDPTVPAIPASIEDPIAAAVAESFRGYGGGYGKYGGGQSANCVGSICTTRGVSNLASYDVQRLIRRMDSQKALIDQLQYELVARNGRIAHLQRDINYAVGMY